MAGAAQSLAASGPRGSPPCPQHRVGAADRRGRPKQTWPAQRSPSPPADHGAAPRAHSSRSTASTSLPLPGQLPTINPNATLSVIVPIMNPIIVVFCKHSKLNNNKVLCDTDTSKVVYEMYCMLCAVSDVNDVRRLTICNAEYEWQG